MNNVKLIIYRLCRFIAGFMLQIQKFFPRRTKRILLVGSSEVTIDYLLDIDKILQDLGNQQSFMLVTRPAHKFARARLSEHPGRIILIRRFIFALCLPWDLIIFADHNNSVRYHPRIRKIRCPHGLYSGKTHEQGGSYVYGQKALDPKGNLIYDLMFVESFYLRQALLRANPALNGKLAVVGNLMADDLIAMNQKHEIVRQNLGIQEKDRVLVIFSTWGPHSLIQKFGVSLMKEIPKISKSYKVYLSIHPLNARKEFSDQDTISKFIELYKRNGMAERIDPLASWMPYLVAADIVLTDHTSLFLYYALLGKPYLFIPLECESLAKDSLTWKFYKLQEKYNPNLALCDQLDHIIINFPVKAHKKIANLIVDESGNAKRRIQAEITKLW